MGGVVALEMAAVSVTEVIIDMLVVAGVTGRE